MHPLENIASSQELHDWQWWLSLLANAIEVGAFIWAVAQFKSINAQVEARLLEMQNAELRITTAVEQFAQRIRFRARLPDYLTTLEQHRTRLEFLTVHPDEVKILEISGQCRFLCRSIRKSTEGALLLMQVPQLLAVLERLRLGAVSEPDLKLLRVELANLSAALTEHQQDIISSPQ